MAAVRGGHEAVCRLLLSNGAQPNHVAEDGWTPLRAAAWAGHLHLVRLLLEEGAEVSILCSFKPYEKGVSNTNSMISFFLRSESVLSHLKEGELNFPEKS